VGGNDATDIDRFTRDLAGFHKADAAHYDACCTAAWPRPPSWTR
jgi:hypothetical protein